MDLPGEVQNSDIGIEGIAGDESVINIIISSSNRTASETRHAGPSIASLTRQAREKLKECCYTLLLMERSEIERKEWTGLFKKSLHAATLLSTSP